MASKELRTFPTSDGHLVTIGFVGGGEVPESLKGEWKAGRADIAIKNYLTKRKATKRGKSDGKKSKSTSGTE